jgi:small subunit ribosomal protein S19
MSRSLKKGPIVDENLIKKITKMKAEGRKDTIKTWARWSQISPDMVGLTISIHNGKNFISVFISEAMVGHKLGEFAPTRTFRTHGRVVERTSSPT